MSRARRFTVFLAPSAVAAVITVASSHGADQDAGLLSITAAALKGHIYFLASDEMGGRDSLSHEGRIAAEDIAAFYHRAGLKAVGDNGTFFQTFPKIEKESPG
jgi:hypothetical protein